MRAILRRLRRDDSGLSLTELLVSTMLTLLVLIMVGNMFISATRITLASNQTRTSNDVATNIVNEVSSVLRFSTDLIKADDSIDFAVNAATTKKVTVYSLYAIYNTSGSTPAPSKITFELVRLPGTTVDSVTETRCPGTLSGTVWTFSTTCTTRNLGTGVVPDSTPLFSYLDANGNAIVTGSGLSSGDRDKVASIIVTVRSQAEKAKTPFVVITNTVVLRNLGLDPTP